MLTFTVIPKKAFGTWQFGKIGVFVHFIIQELKVYKLLSFCIYSFFVSVSLVKENLRKSKGNLKNTKFEPKIFPKVQVTFH